MALSITSQSQEHAGCVRRTITVNLDGVSRTFMVTSDDLTGAGFQDLIARCVEHGGAQAMKLALLFLTVRYKMANGATFNSLVGVDLVS